MLFFVPDDVWLYMLEVLMTKKNLKLIDGYNYIVVVLLRLSCELS